jgi:tRNA pseudouridine55 synthase
MNGVLNILKPSGMTSFDVVAYIRKLTKVKKVGHTGTLDPHAVGVLPILVGNATKLSDLLMNHEKEYRVNLRLGVATSTVDSDGEIISKCDCEFEFQQVEAVIKSFIGEIEQKPPMFSAIKVNGKKLYELARKGQEVEVQKRKVVIHDIKNIKQVGKNEYRFDVSCSKGTYIRSLCVDIGEKLNVPAFMSRLIRMRSGDFKISSAYTLEEVAESIDDKIIPIDELIHYPKAYVKDEALKYILNGRSSYINCLNEFEYKEDGLIRLYDMQKNFIGLAKIYDEGDKKVFKVSMFLRTGGDIL